MGTTASQISSVQFINQMNVTEALQDAPAASGQNVTSVAFNPSTVQYTPSTTIPMVNYSGVTYTLSGGGAATIDLTDLLGTQGNIDGTGLRVRALRVQGSDASNGALTISPGASNPYEFFGPGNELVYPAGNTKPITFEFEDGLALITDVSGVGASQIDLAGDASDEFKIEIIVG